MLSPRFVLAQKRSCPLSRKAPGGVYMKPKPPVNLFATFIRYDYLAGKKDLFARTRYPHWRIQDVTAE
jgi:hypothetical protein